MSLFGKNKGKDRMARLGIAFLMAASSAMAVFSINAMAADSKHESVQKSFTSPEEAAAALVAAAKSDDVKELLAILGPEGRPLIFSGDEVADRNGRERFVRMYEEKNRVAGEAHAKAVLEVGNDAWPFPIPIVEAGGEWRFDTREGKQEILSRRIGKNELSTIQACLAYVDAQREYASKDRNGDGQLEYARKFASEPGKEDGLYWESEEGVEQSPLGPLVASARQEGYTRKKPGDKPRPYHGYLFKILEAQGRNAPGGTLDYVVRDKMIGGFALVAYPAAYESSGIMTFVVSHGGDVYEKDMGKTTASVAQGMKTFDPDKTWRKVEPKYIEPAGQGGGT